jgi:hypothetical protein
MTGMTSTSGLLTRRHRLAAAISPAAMTACHPVPGLVVRLPAWRQASRPPPRPEDPRQASA